MGLAETNAQTLALQALAWTLDEPARASRLLGVTGLTPEDLRVRAADPRLLSALIGFLASEDLAFSTGATFDVSGGRAVY